MRVVRGLPDARALLCEGRGLDLDDTSPHLAAAIERAFGEPLSVAQVVDHIIAQVRSRGDDALRELAETLDGARIDEIRVPPREVANALEVAPPPLVEALELAAGRIAEFHEATLRRSWFDFRKGYGELVNPVERGERLAPTRRYSRLPGWPASTACTALAAPRRSRRWRTAPSRCRAST